MMQEKYEQYLLVFSGGYFEDKTLAIGVIYQLSLEAERFGIEKLELIESSLANLVNDYLLSLSGDHTGKMHYDYSTIKITYNKPVAFRVNEELDTFLRGVVLSLEIPCGAHYSYLVEEDGILSFHNTSVVYGCTGIYETGDEGFYEEVISPEALYRAFYNQPPNEDDHALIAKMLLVSAGESLEAEYDL